MDFNILTFHSALNHGAVLQAYALQKFIDQLGYEVGIYDYRPSTAGRYSGVKGKLFKLIRKLDEAEYIEKENKFNKFIAERLKLNKIEDCHAFLVGSDQVWNTGSSMNLMYFLRFCNEKTIRASYAASMGSTIIAPGKLHRIQKYVSDFDFISVREEGIRSELAKIIDKEINVNIDPTLLFTAEEWDDLCKPVEIIKGKYILVYIMHFSRNVNKLLKWLKKETGYDILVIDGQGAVQGKLTKLIYHDIALHNVGPQEFLWLVKNAESVVTSSFHGTAFSIIFEKELYSIVNPAAPSRINNLLELVGINPISEDAVEFQRATNVRWESVRKILAQEKTRSEQYIRLIYNTSKTKKPVVRGNISFVGDRCTGCMTCESACPAKAIKTQLNPDGFYYPEVDNKKCIICGRCVAVCPTENFRGLTRKRAYYGWAEDDKILFNSSSGGAFRVFANQVLSNGGIVYSAVYSDDYYSVVFADSDSESVEKMQKSKYTASNPTGVYSLVMQQLQSGRQVLFCGTPCQVAGLSNFLGQDYSNLITCDFVCGGMASLKFYREHLQLLEKQKCSRISNIDFRPKDSGWGKHHISINFDNGTRIYKREYDDTYFTGFAIEHVAVRRSCLECDWHALHCADITLADFWGYRSAGVEANDQGTSLLVANNEKGIQYISGLKEFSVFEIDLSNTDYAFGTNNPSDEKLSCVKRFFECAQTKGFETTAHDFYSIGFFGQLSRKLKRYVKRR